MQNNDDERVNKTLLFQSQIKLLTKPQDIGNSSIIRQVKEMKDQQIQESQLSQLKGWDPLLNPKSREYFKQALIQYIKKAPIKSQKPPVNEDDPVAVKEEQLLQNAINIIKKSYYDRKQSEINQLNAWTSDINFFKNINNSSTNNIQIVEQCLYSLEYEFIPKGQSVFLQGDLGEKYYIIFDGTVGCLVNLVVNNELVLKEVCKLTSKASFGDSALYSQDARRKATVITLTDCHFGVLYKNLYERILLESEAIFLQQKLEYLQILPYFNQLDKRDLNKIIYNFEESKHNFGQYLYREGDKPEFIYIILKGEFKLKKLITYQKENKNQIPQQKQTDLFKLAKDQNTSNVKEIDIQILGVNQIIGEYEAFQNIKRQYSLVCSQQDSVVTAIRIKNFFQFGSSQYQQFKNICLQSNQIKDNHFQFIHDKLQDKVQFICDNNLIKEENNNYFCEKIKNQYIGVNNDFFDDENQQSKSKEKSKNFQKKRNSVDGLSLNNQNNQIQQINKQQILNSTCFLKKNFKSNYQADKDNQEQLFNSKKLVLQNLLEAQQKQLPNLNMTLKENTLEKTRQNSKDSKQQQGSQSERSHRRNSAQENHSPNLYYNKLLLEAKEQKKIHENLFSSNKLIINMDLSRINKIIDKQRQEYQKNLPEVKINVRGLPRLKNKVDTKQNNNEKKSLIIEDESKNKINVY